MNKFTRRFAAVLATGALVAAGLALSATAANADVVTGNIKLFTSGSAQGTIAAKQITSGSSTSNPMYWGITVDQICPSGYRSGSSIQIAQGGVRIGGIGQLNDPSLDGTYGVNGLKPSDTGIAMDESTTVPSQNPYVDNNKSLETAAPALVTGTFELRYYCLADNTSPDYVNDKFFSLTLNFDKTAHTWSVPVAKINTTTAITASGNPATNVATIGITVKNASDGTTATASTGTATVNQTAPSAATLGTASIVNGVATFTTAALPSGIYTFTVSYGGDTSYNGSTSGSATVSFSSTQSTTNITFDVLAGANPGGLVLSNVPTSVDLGSATYNAGLLTASNLTGFSGITVTDNRTIGAASWALTGSVSDFTSGALTLSGKYLGWTPALTSGPAGAAAGATVLPAAESASTGGLKTVSTLATAPLVNGSPVTVVKAGLNVAIPANSAVGHYSAVLTLTVG
jgi:hypothetical protein